MKIITCCKVVPDEEQIQVLPNRKLSMENTPWKISQYDLNALEAGKTLAAETGGTMTALSVGGSTALQATKIQKDILSRGPDDLSLVVDDAHSFSDSLETAKAIAAALNGCGGFDLALCGTGSSDLYAQEVGIQVGALLGIPAVNNVTAIAVKGDVLEVERTLEDSMEVLEITLPAILSLSSEINIPAVPAMREIMRAGKKPVNTLEVSLAEIVPAVKALEELAPEQQERRMQVIEGDNDEAVEALLQFLKKEVL
ncbi:MAG: putative electron transfer flavoprotein FixA [Pseudoflavonifractor sp.]